MGWNAYTYGVLALSVVVETARLVVSFFPFDCEQLEDSSRLFLLDSWRCYKATEYYGCRCLVTLDNSLSQKTERVRRHILKATTIFFFITGNIFFVTVVEVVRSVMSTK